MTDREAMQQAIKAMEYADACLNKQLTTKTKHEYAQDLLMEAGTVLRERLAQPKQEPVVWMYQDKSTHEVRFQKHMRDFVDHGATYETPLYTTPPAQRTWVGLTDEEIEKCIYDANNDPIVACRNVEAAHGIKENT